MLICWVLRWVGEWWCGLACANRSGGTNRAKPPAPPAPNPRPDSHTQPRTAAFNPAAPT